MCTGALPAFMSVHYMHAVPLETREGYVGFLGTRVTEPGSVRATALITEQLLQPPSFHH